MSTVNIILSHEIYVVLNHMCIVTYEIIVYNHYCSYTYK